VGGGGSHYVFTAKKIHFPEEVYVCEIDMSFKYIIALLVYRSQINNLTRCRRR